MRLMFMFLSLLLLGGCASSKIAISVDAAPYLNPNQTGIAEPVELVVYQLRTSDGFQQASFDQLWQQDEMTLGTQLLRKQKYYISPNSHQLWQLQRDPNAEYVGAVALFRQPDSEHWRVVTPLNKTAPGFDNHVRLSLKSNQLREQ